MRKLQYLSGLLLSATLLFTACDSAEEDAVAEEQEEEQQEDKGPDIGVLAEKFYYDESVTVVVGENELTITSHNEPDHKSMYYAQNHALYESYSEPNNPDFKKNPNAIEAQDIVFKVPRYPAEATTKEATPMGPMGIAINGIVLFNQQAAPGDDILDELNTFDQYEGHPQDRGMYHYHNEPVYLTAQKGNSAFIGLLLDGYPVYGPEENGKRISNSDLDDYHGHVSATAEFPDGIYHYHITDDLPWINGDGFFGATGTVTF